MIYVFISTTCPKRLAFRCTASQESDGSICRGGAPCHPCWRANRRPAVRAHCGYGCSFSVVSWPGEVDAETALGRMRPELRMLSGAFDGFGGCEVCEDGIELSRVSQGMLRVTRWYGAFHNDIASRCCCSRCREDWFDKGWICPGLYTADLFDDAQ